MIKRDDAISIKELVKRANSNRSKVYKAIIRDWSADPIHRNFIFQVDAPGTKTGKMWFIKKPAVSRAIQILTSLSPTEQGMQSRKQEQGIRIEKEITRVNKDGQEPVKQEVNKVDVSFVEFLKEQIKVKDKTIDNLYSQLNERERNWKDQFDFLKKLLPAPKLAGKQPDAAELATDRNVEQQRMSEKGIPPVATVNSVPPEPQPAAPIDPQPQPVQEPDPMPETEAVPPVESYASEVGETPAPERPQKENQPQTSANTSFADNSYPQRQDNFYGL